MRRILKSSNNMLTVRPNPSRRPPNTRGAKPVLTSGGKNNHGAAIDACHCQRRSRARPYFILGTISGMRKSRRNGTARQRTIGRRALGTIGRFLDVNSSVLGGGSSVLGGGGGGGLKTIGRFPDVNSDVLSGGGGRGGGGGGQRALQRKSTVGKRRIGKIINPQDGAPAGGTRTRKNENGRGGRARRKRPLAFFTP